ncbi:hypothetical protein BGX27_001873 [Mortierella sp. AM989]|nr:hypothetical protein BGX27_001873 [Mortierella sp. AM989]
MASKTAMNPLSIPEIRTLVSQFLANSPPALLSCALVSRAWSSDFLPRLWYSIRFDYHLSQLMTPHRFRRYEHLIRCLFIHDPTFFLNGFYGEGCKNLIRLEFVPHIAKPIQIQSASASSFNTVVPTNEYDFVNEYDSVNESDNNGNMFNHNRYPPDTILDPININTALSIGQRMHMTIQLHKLVGQQDSLVHLVEEWSHLTHEMRGLWIQPFHSPTPSTCLKLTTLSLSKWPTSTGEFNEMIRACPNLIYLFLRSCEISRFTSLPSKSHQQQNAEETIFHDDSTVLDFGQVKILRLDQLCLQGDPITIQGERIESIEVESYATFEEWNIYQVLVGPSSMRNYSWIFPNVSSLKFTGKGSSLYQTEAEHFINSVLSPPTRNLSQLHSQESVTHNLPDESRQQQLVELVLNNFQISASIVNNIHLRLGDAIDVIDFGSCEGLGSKDVQQVLIHCGNLRVFQGPETFFWTQDMISSTTGPGWASNKLQEFVVLVGIGATEDLSCVDTILEQDSTRRSVETTYEQLSRQQALEILDLSGDIDFDLIDDCRKGIPLVLKAGLDKLKTLKNIRHVIVTAWEDEMGVAEAEWMKIHWPKLEYIHSREGGTSDGWRQFENTLDLPVQINSIF